MIDRRRILSPVWVSLHGKPKNPNGRQGKDPAEDSADQRIAALAHRGALGSDQHVDLAHLFEQCRALAREAGRGRRRGKRPVPPMVARAPVKSASPFPRFTSWRRTRHSTRQSAAARWHSSSVWSLLPSSTTTISTGPNPAQDVRRPARCWRRSPSPGSRPAGRRRDRVGRARPSNGVECKGRSHTIPERSLTSRKWRR